MNWFLEQLPLDMTSESIGAAARLAMLLALGGVLGWFVRVLYTRFSSSVSNTDSFSSVFPVLTMVTIAVIAVVKSSLALSLGLVGALSIVRFRAAIKDPEELVYLFLCIGVGLALGAGHVPFAVVLVFASAVYVVGRWARGRGPSRHNLILTVTSDDEAGLLDSQNGAMATLREVPGLTIQRLDLDGDQNLIRVLVDKATPEETVTLVGGLRERLPSCRISYVNADSIV